MKKKIKLTIAFLVSLLPMLLNQYGGKKGVQEISGLINLLNPIGIISVLLFIMGVMKNLECKYLKNLPKVNKKDLYLQRLGILIQRKI